MTSFTKFKKMCLAITVNQAIMLPAFSADIEVNSMSGG